MEHTPGPWTADTKGCKDVSGMLMLPIMTPEAPLAFVPIRLVSQPHFWPESLANARLIAAAPDLLAELHGALQEDICPCCGRDNTGYLGCTSEDCPGVQAIVKAREGEPA